MRLMLTGTFLALLASVLVGCRGYYAEQADRDVYRAVGATHEREFGFEREFSIDGGPSRNANRSIGEIVSDLPPSGELPEMLQGSRLAGQQLRLVNLPLALRISQENSRRFQSRKEQLYLSALDLTRVGYAFDTRYALGGDITYLVSGPDRTETLLTGADFSITRQLMTGTLVGLNLGLTGVKYLNSELGSQLISALDVTVAQPLWRGAHPMIVQAELIQARRNVVYDLRGFVRFEKEFAVDVASSYYQVLQQMDVVRNEWQNYQNLTYARQRSESLSEVGRLPTFQVDQARQDELRAENRYIVAVENFEGQLDSFRILLGLPTDAPVVIDFDDLERLVGLGIASIDADPEEAVEEALQRRLDLLNTRQRIEDADRRVYIAADALKGDVRLVGSARVGSDPPTQAGRFLFHEGRYAVGLEVDLPIDRLVQRNAYRRSLIDYDVAMRQYMDGVDQVKLQIRQALRRLRRAELSYEIQARGVELAQRRVRSTQLLLEVDRASTRDLLESQEALVSAQNALSQALVSHLVARLEFLRDMELLEVTEDWQLEEARVLRAEEPAGDVTGDMLPAIDAIGGAE